LFFIHLNIIFFCGIMFLYKPDMPRNKKISSKKSKSPSHSGFTLIELLVVVAIIALLSSVALIAMISARQKSRDAKRLGDMTQMMNALEIYFSYNKGYPSSTNGIPTPLSPSFVATIPKAPNPADGGCDVENIYVPGIPANNYYYAPSGTAFLGTNGMVYPDYKYYFCLGDKTGNFLPGLRYITPTGIK
jgi:prepilin-type N-terminal cleavage/methylation domain-containing protein